MKPWILILFLATGEIAPQAMPADDCMAAMHHINAGALVIIELEDGRSEQVTGAWCAEPMPDELAKGEPL